MKRYTYTAAFFLITWVLPLHGQVQQARKDAFVLKRMLEELHYSPRTFDDKFSEQVFYRFIERLDPQHLYFTAADIKELSAYRHSIDEELQGASWSFLERTASLYRHRLAQADSLIPLLLQKPFDFSLKESMVVEPDSLDFAADDKEGRARLARWLKYNTLQRLADLAASDTINNPAAGLKQEASIREKVKIVQQRKIKKILEHPWGYDAYIASLFFNSITGCFDPHTVYMPPADEENFEGDVTGVRYSFGLQLDENEQGEVIIVHLVPGAPAWRSGELNKDDVLLKLKWANKPETDLSAASLEEVEEMLSDLNHDRLELTVRKAGGIEKTVLLVKEKVRDDENFVKSFVLAGEKKIGYISLPGFYTEWGNEAGSSCANDVAKELVKLKQEKIEGLVLDLRNNGGGSMQEAIDMAGIFIDEGPLGFVKGRDPKPRSFKDINRGTIYDGPLLVLVNGQSASASEMVAGTLQDYNRAIIAGNSTYGKATVQVVLPLDTVSAENGSRGYLKLTIQKLYRVTGKTNQVKGVTPDVQLPDILAGISYRESSEPFALAPDTVKRSSYFHPLNSLPVSDLSAKSSARVDTSNDFKTVKEIASGIGEMYSQSTKTVPLSWDEYMKLVIKRNRIFGQVEKQLGGASQKLYNVDNNAFDKDRISPGGYGDELNTQWLRSIMGDIYIQESYRIISDLINSSK